MMARENRQRHTVGWNTAVRRAARRVYGARLREAGGAFLEFILIFPLLVFLVYAIVDFGSYLSELSRVNQTVFEIIRRGSEISHYSAIDGTKAFAARVLPLHRRYLEDAQVNIQNDVTVDFYDAGTTTDVSDDILRLKVNMPMHTGLSQYFQKVAITYSAHYLKRSVGGAVGLPMNPPLVFDCSGQPTGCSEADVKNGNSVDSFDCGTLRTCP